MFERYTGRARRVIFFARYEASQFGSRIIESEHFLLGLIRENERLVQRFIRTSSSIVSIRKEIEGRSTIREKVSTSIDLPISQECRRILALANEEADRLQHRHIGTEHLLLGILREEGCTAFQILHAQGLRLETLREELAASPPEEEETIYFPTMAPTCQALVTKLVGRDLAATNDHLGRAAIALSVREYDKAQFELQNVLQTLVDAIKQRNPEEEVFAPLLKGFIYWPVSLRDIRTGLSGEDDCKFKFSLTLLLAEFLLMRFPNR